MEAKADGFSDVYFVTSKRSAINGKATHFEANSKASVCYFLGKRQCDTDRKCGIYRRQSGAGKHLERSRPEVFQKGP